MRLLLPLVHTVRNTAQIANKIIVNFKTEFFNRIGHNRTSESKTCGFLSLTFGGFGYVVVGIILNIEAGCQIASRSTMPAIGQ